MRILTRNVLKQWLDAAEPFYLINVLKEDQFAQAHIPGSINIPVDSDRFVRDVKQVVKDKQATIVVYCASFSCTASPTAARKLEQAGFEQVYDYEGGMKDWQEAGMPVQSDRSQRRGFA